MKTQNFGPFLGLNNRLPDFALRVATSQLNGQYLRTADNVDVDNAGKLRRRNGTTLVQAMSGVHSLHMTSDTTALLVRAGTLYAVTLPTYSETLLKVLTSNATMSYAALGDSLYFSNGTDSGRLTAGAYYPLALQTPESPAVSVIGGSLEPGWYQIGVSYSNSVTGEEGGISASANIELTGTGGIRATLPGATIGATHVNVYLSAANGEVPMLLATVDAASGSYDCTTLATGRETTGRFERPLPAGTLFTSNGRLCSFSGSTVYVGQPFRPGYYLPAEGYIPFPADVSIAVENQGGTYIVAQKTHWFPGGDLNNVEGMVNDVLPYGAVPGTAFSNPSNTLVGWFGDKGVVVGTPSGTVEALTAENVDVTSPVSGVSAVFESDGHRRVVSCGHCVNLENSGATTYSDWDFTSLSGDYGTKADGVYRTDSGAAVNATIGFGKVDFGTDVLKHLPACYLAVDAEYPMQLRVQTPGEVDYTYTARNSSTDLCVQRVDPGKGLRANYFELTLSNSEGSAFTLASVSFAPTASNRRI